MFEQPQEEQGGNKALIIGLAVGALVVITVLGVIFYQSYAQKRNAEIKRNLEKRAKEQAARRDYLDRSYGSTILKGKIAVFNLDENTMDISQDKLPVELRAMSEDELATLVTVSCKTELEAYYYYENLKDSNTAWGKQCRLQVIDLLEGKIVGRKEIYGYAPPLQSGSQKNAVSVDAKHPDEQIIAYLTTLPRQ